MNPSILNIPKIIVSILVLFFAYHFFSLGTTLLKENKKILLITEKKQPIINKLNNEDIEQKDEIDQVFNEKNAEQTSILEQQKIDISPKIITKINEVIVKKNQTFDSILKNEKITNSMRINIITEISKLYNLKKLPIGQKIIFNYREKDQNTELVKITLPLSFKEELVLENNLDNKFIAKKIDLPIFSEKKIFKVNIEKSLYQSAVKFKVPNSVIIDLIRLYSFDVDFQRDIRVNDNFVVMYEVFYNEQRREVAFGNILYSNLILQKRELEYFLFETSEGIDYFDRKGKNVRKALMKTPIDGARLSSGFGMRKHPILGYNVKHRGVDFAAPTGTPVFAAGNGKIEFIGTNGAYGKYIRIKHNNSYKTAYAHLSGYKKGISKSVRVNQGEIIGYVGSTGRSTGPHLHYEVIFNGKKINPMKMKLPSGKSLKNEELNKFLEYSEEIFSFVIKNI